MTKKFLLYSSPFFLLFCSLSLLEPWIYRNFLASTNLERLKGRQFQIIAHKGASGLAPENTLAAFQKALDLKVDQIEMDLRNTSDEHIVIFHDQRIDRVARDSAGNRVSGNVHDLTLAELKKMDIGSWYDPTYKDQQIPTLKEALDLVDGQTKVLLEIKYTDHPHYHDFSEKLIKIILSEKNGRDWIILQSYESSYLDEIHELDSLVQTKALVVGEDSAPLIAFYIETRIHMGRAQTNGRLKAINPNWLTLSPRRVFQLHAKGYKVHAYPVNNRHDMIIMLQAGVDGIITDFPNVAIALREDIQNIED